MPKKYMWGPKNYARKTMGVVATEKIKHIKRGYIDAKAGEKIYGTTYTERQLCIISGDLPWEVVRINEISLIVNKSKQMNDMETYEKALALRELKKNQGAYIPQMTPEEAKDILKRLTPSNE